MMTPAVKPVRVRFAPSPTGPFHLGGARTALFNWLFARQNKGKFVLRIEDTDTARSEKRYEAEIFEGLRWLGLSWDEGLSVTASGKNSAREASYIGDYGPYRQSERKEIYKRYLDKLIAENKAYYCYCTKEELEAERQAMTAQGLPPKYGGHCRNLTEPPAGKKPQVIRFKTPEAPVEFKDIIRGKITFDASLFGDLAIAKDSENPLFNFAGAVDDYEMRISHVIRGEDHLSNTPKQILFQKALGFDEPEYAHMPLILNPDRSKMSKRFADTALLEYRVKGYLPEAMINFLALLGWHTQENREVWNAIELIEKFDLKRVQKAGAIFDQEKLDWLEKEHVRKLSAGEIANRLKQIMKEKGIAPKKSFLLKVIEAERPRLFKLNEFPDLAGFFFELPEYEPTLLNWQKEPIEKIRSILNEIAKIIGSLEAENFNRDNLSAALADIISKEGRGAVLWPLRVAVSGRAASPDPFDIMPILGKEESEKRLAIALAKLEKPLL